MRYSQNYLVFTLVSAGQEHRLQSHVGEYRNLRDLISDKLFLDNFGECGGMVRCATCLVEVHGIDAAMNRNEPATLSKAGIIQSNVRLACQIPVDDDLANTIVILLDH